MVTRGGADGPSIRYHLGCVFPLHELVRQRGQGGGDGEAHHDAIRRRTTKPILHIGGEGGEIAANLYLVGSGCNRQGVDVQPKGDTGRAGHPGAASRCNYNGGCLGRPRNLLRGKGCCDPAIDCGLSNRANAAQAGGESHHRAILYWILTSIGHSGGGG